MDGIKHRGHYLLPVHGWNIYVILESRRRWKLSLMELPRARLIQLLAANLFMGNLSLCISYFTDNIIAELWFRIFLYMDPDHRSGFWAIKAAFYKSMWNRLWFVQCFRSALKLGIRISVKIYHFCQFHCARIQARKTNRCGSWSVMERNT